MKTLNIKKLNEIFKALSEKNRLKTLYFLMKHEEVCSCQITEFMGVRAATTSKHMNLLLTLSLVESRKEGRWLFYKLRTNNIALSPLLDWVKTNIEHDIDSGSLDKLMANIMQRNKVELCRQQRGIKCCPNNSRS